MTFHELVEKGDPKAVMIWNAMIYQIIKWIGMMSTPLKGQVDAILLTGGLMRFDDITEGIRNFTTIGPDRAMNLLNTHAKNV